MSSRIGAAFGFVRKRVGSLLQAEQSRDMLAMLAPPKGQSLATRVLLLGGTLIGLAAMGALASGAFLLLMVAVGIMYWLLTSVLGLKLSIDPRAAYDAFSRAAAARPQ